MLFFFVTSLRNTPLTTAAAKEEKAARENEIEKTDALRERRRKIKRKMGRRGPRGHKAEAGVVGVYYIKMC